MMNFLLAAEETAPKGPPSQPWREESCSEGPGYGGCALAEVDKWVNWAMYLGLFVVIVAGIIMASMMAVDRNRGEAGIASSDQARWLKWAMGAGVIMCAPQLSLWIINAGPW